MENKTKLILFALFFGSIFLIFFSLEKILLFPDTDWPLEKGEKEKIHTEVVQKITVEKNNLAGLKILFGSFKTGSGGIFFLEILDANCQKTLRDIKLPIKKTNPDGTFRFRFEKIKNSAGKDFCFKLRYTPKPDGRKAEVFIIENFKPEKKYFSLNDQVLDGKSIPFRPMYKNDTVWGDIEELNQRISQYKPWFLKHYFLHCITFGFIILSLLLFIIILRIL